MPQFRVIDHHRNGSSRRHGVGDIGIVALAEHPPVAAMDEDVHGHRAIEIIGKEDIEALVWARSEGNARLHGQPLPRRIAAVDDLGRPAVAAGQHSLAPRQQTAQ